MWHPRKQVPCSLIRDTASLLVVTKGLHVANTTLYLGFFSASQPNHLLARVQWGKQTPARAQAGAWGLCVPSAQAGSMHACKLWREGRALATLPQTEHGQQSW